MKKSMSLAVVSVLLALPALSFAVGNHPMAGCGLAYTLYASKSNKRGIQTFASSTNNLFGFQTFGITSGTMGCTEEGLIAKGEEIEAFAEVNIEKLRYEMAIGDGPYVTALATLIGATANEVPILVQFFQQEYASLFPLPETSSLEMLTILNDKIKELSPLS